MGTDKVALRFDLALLLIHIYDMYLEYYLVLG